VRTRKQEEGEHATNVGGKKEEYFSLEAINIEVASLTKSVYSFE
jgi:hypothetical protein